MKKILRRGGLVLAVLVVIRVVVGCFFPSLNINDVTTGKTPQYPDIQPQSFAKPAGEVFDAASAVAHAQQDWEVTQEDRTSGTIQAVATTLLMHFKDDVTITVAAAGDGTTVNMRSHSRVGKGDLGTNAHRIRTFQADLARRMTTSSR
jgi:uncharacterized protein (DUF1499 family)